jgi:hypothetical protein
VRKRICKTDQVTAIRDNESKASECPTPKSVMLPAGRRLVADAPILLNRQMNNNFPAISLLVLTYNQRNVLDSAVASALAQDCPPIEIILSDDGSSDGSLERLQKLALDYAGPHRVLVRSTGCNVGIAEHYNQLVRFASGELLITAAGDDICTPDRVRQLAQAWDATGCRADLIASYLIDLDQQGEQHGTLRVDDLSQWHSIDQWFAQRPHIIGAGHAFTKRMMQRFGPLQSGLAYEDQIMVFRAVCMGGAVTVNTPLVHYRRGGTSGHATQFDSAVAKEHWKARNAARMVCEMHQLIADADTAGCGQCMRLAMDLPLLRERYLRSLKKSASLEPTLAGTSSRFYFAVGLASTQNVAQHIPRSHAQGEVCTAHAAPAYASDRVGRKAANFYAANGHRNYPNQLNQKI